ncbi:MAG: hypothetical protein QGH60_00825 [Phycisphaerae bacterium]|jgi:hypothetical protein|nr:hypothetical protein [Phycisphaerae bacterium]
MNNREKILAIITGGIICVIVLGAFINGLFLSPSGTLDNSIRKAKKSLADLAKTAKSLKSNKDHLEDLAARTFGRDDDEVRAATFGYLMAALDRSGLTSEGKGVNAGHTKSSGDLRETAWHVVKSGKMEHILNLLYMLEEDTVLHRIENLAISPRERDGPFRVEFDYVALSLVAKKGPQFAKTRPADMKLAIDMKSERRKRYNVIPERDIFRRYIKYVAPPKPPVVVKAKPPVRKADPPKPPAGPKPRYRICGLPMFRGAPEIWVVNEIDKTGAVHKYKEGEKLMGWKIVMVDYRQLPDPDKPELLSPARVIVRIDSDYWAIEGNQYVNAKRILKGPDLPPALRVAGDTEPTSHKPTTRPQSVSFEK